MSEPSSDNSSSDSTDSVDMSSELLVTIAPGQDHDDYSTLTDEAICMWHDTKTHQMVVRNEAVPPHFCPLTGTKVLYPEQSLTIIHHPLWALCFFFLHPLLAMWIARNFTKQFSINFALSQKAKLHIKHGTRLMHLGMILQLVPISLWMLVAVFVILGQMDVMLYLLGAVVVGMFSFLGFMLMIFGQREANLFEIEKIDGEFAWISGVHEDFLHTLPEAM